MPKPLLKVTGLHIEGLRALQRVDWPADGMGWNGKVPDVVLVGGVNGSGKTTLLELVSVAIGQLQAGTGVAHYADSSRSWIDCLLSTSNVDFPFRVRIVERDAERMNRMGGALSLSIDSSVFVESSEFRLSQKDFEDLFQAIRDDGLFAPSDVPGLVYLDAARTLTIPDTDYKAAGKYKKPITFWSRIQRPGTWEQSLEALLYAARWQDLNAVEAGRRDLATHFESYVSAFHLFFEGRKRLVWKDAELQVHLVGEDKYHSLLELSSGEKQVLVTVLEIAHRWRPGSLILIDEPELHLHEAWQTKLWQFLVSMQKERGGQVIATTQSGHLFEIAESGTAVLLGRARPR